VAIEAAARFGEMMTSFNRGGIGGQDRGSHRDGELTFEQRILFPIHKSGGNRNHGDHHSEQFKNNLEEAGHVGRLKFVPPIAKQRDDRTTPETK
jgi:hypothetical protein